MFNELAKKITGIETDPIHNADDDKPKGFVLGGAELENNGSGAVVDDKRKKPKSGKGCGC